MFTLLIKFKWIWTVSAANNIVIVAACEDGNDNDNEMPVKSQWPPMTIDERETYRDIQRQTEK